jgi:guanylate kinase
MAEEMKHLKTPRVFFLDGASGTGKTTLALMVASHRTDVSLIPRYTTRPKRADSDEREYVFISKEEFEELRDAGEFIESRDYDFGMSYGLPKAPIDIALRSNRHALAIVNLGRIKVAKSNCPDAIAILIDAPPAIIEYRLLNRGVHSEDQIAERLKNAASVDQYRDAYDYIVPNAEDLDSAAQHLNLIIDKY